MKDYVLERKPYHRGSEPLVSNSKHLTMPARIAGDIATRFALIAAMPDGEYSAGRQKLRLPTADELAVRSCDIADALCKQFESRDWMQDIPKPIFPSEE